MKCYAVSVLLLVSAVGCKRAEEKPAEEKHSEAEEHHEHGEKESARVHVDPDMLRDLRVTTAPVELRPSGDGVTALGELTVNENAYAEVAAPVEARVLSLGVSVGDRVEKGGALARLQSAELGKARAALKTAQARALAARQAAQRKRGLADEKIVAEREAQSAEAEAQAAEAELSAAKASLSALGIDPSDTTEAARPAEFSVRSPVAGTVIERSAIVGQVVSPAKPLFRVGDLSMLWLVVHASEADAVRLRPGAEARVTFAALPAQAFQARVSLVGAQVDPASRTVAVRLEIENRQGTLKPGMSASAFLPLGEKGTTTTAVPAAALQRLENGWYVFLPTDEPGAFERREVGRGRSLGGEVEVLSGLSEGEKVVVEGAFLLKAEFDKSRGEGEHHEH